MRRRRESRFVFAEILRRTWRVATRSADSTGIYRLQDYLTTLLTGYTSVHSPASHSAPLRYDLFLTHGPCSSQSLPQSFPQILLPDTHSNRQITGRTPYLPRRILALLKPKKKMPQIPAYTSDTFHRAYSFSWGSKLLHFPFLPSTPYNNASTLLVSFIFAQP